MGRRPDLQNEVQDAEKPEAGRRGGWEHREARLAVLPDLDGALPYWAVPLLDKSRTTPQCWWCRYRIQTRENLFKEHPERKPQQMILWAEALKEAGKWKSRWRIRDLLAGGRCSQTVLDFLSATDVRRRVPAEEDAASEVSEAELREWEQGAEAEELDAGGGNYHCSFPRRTSRRPQERSKGTD